MRLVLIALLAGELIPLPQDQQMQLSPAEFQASVSRCTVGMVSSKQYCECVVRGFEMFLPRDDWERVRRGGHMVRTDIAHDIDSACVRAVRK